MKLGQKLPFPASLQVDYDRPNVFHAADIDELTRPASADEKVSQQRMRPSASLFKDGCRRFLHNPVAMTCTVILLLLILIIIFAPLIVPYQFDENLTQETGDSSYALLAPFAYSDTEKARQAAGEFVFPHIFGTDGLSRDFFIRVVHGTRVSLIVGFFASVIVLVIGSIYGAISGYFGGKVDLVMMRIVDVIYSLPDIVIILLIAALFREQVSKGNAGALINTYGSGLVAMFIVFALLYWVGMARLVRGQVLSLKQQEYVLAARSIGASPAFIIRKHLLPNSMSVIIISAGLQIPSAIFTESFLSYLGLGVNAPMASLGSLASDGQSYIYIPEQSYLLFIPAITICLIVLALNLIGDGLRDAFDPRLTR
jgi:oligopeptide transport system permease protein